MPTKVFVVEDHQFMRESLVDFLNVATDCEVQGTSESADKALKRLPQLQLDLVLVDVSLPEMSGIDLVGLIREQYPQLICLMLSGHREQSYVRRSLDAGARGFVLKGNPSELPQAIEMVMRGGIYLSKAVAVEQPHAG